MNGFFRNGTIATGVLRLAVCSVVVSALFLAGCSTTKLETVHTELVPFTPEEKAQLEQAKNAEYRLRPGDRLAVDFKYEDELDSSHMLILPDGHLSLPGGVDPVRAGGMTMSELDSTLTGHYAVDYRDPELSVMIEELADLNVYVLGMVQRPGQVKLPPGGMGVLQAVAAAGGFDESAQSSQAVVMRATPEGFLLRQIDLSHLERRGYIDLAVFDLQPFDVVYVPRSPIGDFDYFSRTVLRGALTITQIFWDIYAMANIGRVTSIFR